MSTRAAAASSSRRAKQELVRLLFGHETTSSNSNAACRSKKLDYASYSYSCLRSAYLEKIQTMHPDKNRTDPNYKHNLFVELREAWDKYESIAKIAQKVDEGSLEKVKDFTMFGVGCSFSDNEAEREWRSEITDQACRGWFSSGALAEFTEDNTNTNFEPQQTSLLDEDMFILSDEQAEGHSPKSTNKEENNGRHTSLQAQPRRSLVDKNFRPRSQHSFRS